MKQAWLDLVTAAGRYTGIHYTAFFLYKSGIFHNKKSQEIIKIKAPKRKPATRSQKRGSGRTEAVRVAVWEVTEVWSRPSTRLSVLT